MSTWNRRIRRLALLLTLAEASLNPVRSPAATESIYSFNDLWTLAKQHSQDIQAANHESEAANIAVARASRHWLPRVYLDFHAFETNDSAMNFMSILGQRQFNASDFSPDTLNSPGSHLYERGTLGLDFPLFEGGAKSAMVDFARKSKDAKEWELKASEVGQYAELASQYAGLLVLDDEDRQLHLLLDSVQGTMSSYRIGTQANPVGYSGLLGLKTLKNRLEGLLGQISARKSSLRYQIQSTTREVPGRWRIQAEAPDKFVERVFPIRSGAEGSSSSVLSARSQADALDDAKKAEKGRFLPKIGLFAEGNLYSGNRATSTSYNTGAYVQWDLFSASNFGAIAQAEETAAAARARAESLSLRSQADQQSSLDAINALSTNLNLMNESIKLLEEQSVTARALFRNGSINALQLVEVLSRRVDLLVNRAETQQALIHARSSFMINSSPETFAQAGAQ